MYVSRYIFDPNAGNGPVTPLPMRAGRAYLISTNAVGQYKPCTMRFIVGMFASFFLKSSFSLTH